MSEAAKSEKPQATRVCISCDQFTNEVRDRFKNDTYQCLLAVRERLEQVGITDATNIIAGGMQIWVTQAQVQIVADVLQEFEITSVSPATSREMIDRHGLDGAAAKDPTGFPARILALITKDQN